MQAGMNFSEYLVGIFAAQTNRTRQACENILLGLSLNLPMKRTGKSYRRPLALYWFTEQITKYSIGSRRIIVGLQRK